uniref:Uncharacterized protein n=1 Tax=Arundo donax TaxID=35708 RepID=A0A0A9A8F2_ARUDO
MCCSPRFVAARRGPPSTGPKPTPSTTSELTYQVEGNATWK